MGAQERNRLPASVNQALSSDNSRVEPPDPIPNSEVKRSCADGSVALPCESRSSLDIYTKNPVQKCAGFFSVRHQPAERPECAFELDERLIVTLGPRKYRTWAKYYATTQTVTFVLDWGG